jgi:hypothetical protein
MMAATARVFVSFLVWPVKSPQQIPWQAAGEFKRRKMPFPGPGPVSKTSVTRINNPAEKSRPSTRTSLAEETQSTHFGSGIKFKFKTN